MPNELLILFFSIIINTFFLRHSFSKFFFLKENIFEKMIPLKDKFKPFTPLWHVRMFGSQTVLDLYKKKLNTVF